MRELDVGSDFAGHRIEALVGRSGMALVHRATQLELDRTVALKLIAPQLAEDGEFRARFKRERHLAASIDQPNGRSDLPRGRGGRTAVHHDAIRRRDRSPREARRRPPPDR